MRRERAAKPRLNEPHRQDLCEYRLNTLQLEPSNKFQQSAFVLARIVL